jgi:hypothetical protein
MQMKSGDFCPLIKKKCIGLKCSWYTQVRGMNPNTGDMVDEWSCAINWIPMLQIETSQQARQAGAAVESFRNEVVRANSQNQQLFLDFIDEQKTNGILPTTVTPLNMPINIIKPAEDDEEENNVSE